MNKSLVYIIIVNYNGFVDTKECIESCLCLTYENFSIVIVDNASDNDDIERLKKEYPQVELIVCEDNYGFAIANNKGI